MRYDRYNREERALIAHLFILLHQGLDTDPLRSGLAEILRIIEGNGLQFSRYGLPNINQLDFSRVGILTEVALLRDAYHANLPNITPFMNKLVMHVMELEGAHDCRLYSLLPDELRDADMTHPMQIKYRGRQLFTPDELRVYGTIQSMFATKPDLAVVIDNYMIVFDVKFTEPFRENQLLLTEKIASVWASPLLYGDLGFREPPSYRVTRIGPARARVQISWEEICELARRFYPKHNRTRLALEASLALMG